MNKERIVKLERIMRRARREEKMIVDIVDDFPVFAEWLGFEQIKQVETKIKRYVWMDWEIRGIETKKVKERDLKNNQVLYVLEESKILHGYYGERLGG